MAVEKILSPVAGVVWKLSASVGETLDAGAPVVLVESMKMEIPVCMPRAGKLLRIAVTADEPLTEGQLVAEFE